VEKIFKDLTQRYVSELVKEATKSAVKGKGEKDADKLEAALKGLSDEKRKKLFQESADEIRQKICEGATKDNELIKEISTIIDKHLSYHKIVPDIEVIEGRPTGWGFWTRIPLVAKIAIIIVIVAAAYEFIYPIIFVPELSVDESVLYFEVDKDGPIESKSFTISNAGGGTLRWWLSANENWIELNPDRGSEFSRIKVSIGDSLRPGTHRGEISVESNGGHEDIDVIVHVRQSPPIDDEVFEEPEDSLADCRNWPSRCNLLVDEGNYNEAITCYNEAINCYDEALDKNPKNAEAWYLKGVALVEIGWLLHVTDRYEEGNERFEEAIKCQNEAITLDLNYLEAYTSKAQALRFLDDNEEALDACEEAIKIDSNSAEAWLCKGHTLLNLGRYEGAVEAYDKALERNPPRWVREEALSRKEEAVRAP